jgi:hypothetical protein
MAGATSASLSGLTPGTTYVVTVKATSAAGDSSPGSVNLSTLSREAYYRPTVLADSPVLYYGLDEASGTTAAALAGPSGTYSSGRATTAGKVGAGSLGSAVGSVTAGSRPFAAADASAFSVEAWAKATAPGTFRYVVGDADWTGTKGFAFYTGSTGGLQFAVATTSGKALASVPAAGVWDGTWHHIVGTFASGTARLYVDGALVSTASVAAGAKMLAPSTQDVTIGRFSGTEDTLYFNGSIDEAAVYTTELSAGRVSAHFLAGK